MRPDDRDKKRDVNLEYTTISNKIVPFFEVFRQITATSQGLVNFPYIKMMVSLTPLHVALTESEFEKHNIYQGQSRLLVSLLGPEVKKRGDEDLSARFRSLVARSRACGVVQVAVNREETGDDDTFSFSTSTSIRKSKETASGGEIIKEDKIELQDHDSIEVETTETLAELGREMARDNGYNLINCEAVNTFYGLLDIAAELNLIKFDDSLDIDNRMVKEEDADEKLEQYANRSRARART